MDGPESTGCLDENGCNLGKDECHLEATYLNAVGSYKHDCRTGFEAGGFERPGKDCVDIDECIVETDNCHTMTESTNTKKFFECDCIAFLGDGVINCVADICCLCDTCATCTASACQYPDGTDVSCVSVAKIVVTIEYASS